MRTLVGLGLMLSVGLTGCSKTEPKPNAGASTPGTQSDTAAAPVTSTVAATPAAAASAPPAASAPADSAPATPGTAPASFKGGTVETIGAAVGLGCEAKSLDGWLQLLCRKKNGTGGHPRRAVVLGGEASAATGQEPGANPADAAAPSGNELTPNEQGELTIVVPYSGNEQRDVNIEWTDTSYTLHVTGAKATLEWAGSGIPHRRACQQLLDENKAALTAAQKLEGEARLTTTEASKLPRFGVCQPAGLGSWALSLKAVSGKGEGPARQHHLELEVVRVDVDGARKGASFGSIDVAPGGFEVGSLQAYDYDDDGRDELIVPYELKAFVGETPSYPPAVWSFSDAGVAAYAKGPTVTGGVAIEQLDFDMRPDLATYGSFVAFLGSGCGAKVCPARITGPKLYLHSAPDGSFADRDDAARTALKRTGCQSQPTSVVVEAAGSVNAQQTAKNLVCARAYGATVEVITTELTNKHALLCGEVSDCALQRTFEAWLKVELPVDLSQPLVKK